MVMTMLGEFPCFGFLVLMVYLLGLCDACKFIVGGDDGWTLKPKENYIHWAERNRFEINDTLVFKYEKEHDSVFVVTKKDYSRCNKDDPIKTFKDGNTKFTFDKSGPFFFISGHEQNCEKGQKFVTVVISEHHDHHNHTVPPPPPTHAPAKPPTQTPSPPHAPPPTHIPSHAPLVQPPSHVPSPLPPKKSPTPAPSQLHAPPPTYTPPHSPPHDQQPTHAPSSGNISPTPAPAHLSTPPTSPAHAPPVELPPCHSPAPEVQNFHHVPPSPVNTPTSHSAMLQHLHQTSLFHLFWSLVVV